MENAEKKELKVNGGYPLHTFEELKESYQLYISNETHRKRIEEAYIFVEKAHRGQFRKSGEPYIHHLLEVAYILSTLHSGPDTIISGLLHDVVEDTDVPISYIEEHWGEDVARIVDSVTKIQRMKLSRMTQEDFQYEDHRKIFLGMAKDVRVIIVKLADRLHNMRTLESLSPDRQQIIAKETLEVFAPIAHRLGLYQLKSELEDLSLKYLRPKEFEEIRLFLEKRFRSRKKSLDAVKKRIADILFEHNIPFRIEARAKSIYSLYKKITLKGYNINDIYDILALRVITETELHCYEILGLVNMTYQPVIGRFKDYIATPKTNLYRSLHTTIVSGDGNTYEVQIRTEEMDEVAESGIAAHWKYKEGTNYDRNTEQKEIADRLVWFKDFIYQSEQSDNLDAREYMETLTHDIFEASVYVFTPMGKVVELPQGSTPIDFAYRIHTKVGDTAIGALVNGAMVPLSTELQTGDIIEIKTNKNSSPNEGWLKIVKTATAREHIKKAVQTARNDDYKVEAIEKGKNTLFSGLLNEFGLDEEEAFKRINTSHVLNHFNAEKIENLYYQIALKSITTSQVAAFINLRKKQKVKVTKFNENAINDTNPVLVSGSNDIKIQLAKCCRPIPGDAIVGYISKGRGITIHRDDCPNVRNTTERILKEVEWNPHLKAANYPVDLKIMANDRDNLLTDILAVLSLHRIPVSDVHASLNYETTVSTFKLTIAVNDVTHLTNIINALINVTSVFKIDRLFH